MFHGKKCVIHCSWIGRLLSWIAFQRYSKFVLLFIWNSLVEVHILSVIITALFSKWDKLFLMYWSLLNLSNLATICLDKQVKSSLNLLTVRTELWSFCITDCLKFNEFCRCLLNTLYIILFNISCDILVTH